MSGMWISGKERDELLLVVGQASYLGGRAEMRTVGRDFATPIQASLAAMLYTNQAENKGH